MHRISSLIVKKLTSRLSPQEEDELQAWAGESEGNRRLYDRLTDPMAVKHSFDLWRMVDSHRAAADMQSRINRIIWRQRLQRITVVAAVVAVLLVIVTWILPGGFNMSGNDATEVADAKADMPETAGDIKPGSTYAILTDASGNKVELHATDTAKVAAVLLTELPVSATTTGIIAERELCLDVPRGGEFKMLLEDGTEVWLNSASRLYYPEKFGGDMRKVRVEGEAYFSVATDSLCPFYVETDRQLVRVYGTEFNIRHYPEESMVATTLNSGSLAISRADESGGELFITPGHQAMFDITEAEVSVRTVNTEVVTSWRNGRFVFEHQSLLHIMQDLSRWYDFDYEFTDKSLEKEEFMGSIPRYSDFTTAISILEKCGNIHFAVTGGKVVISRTN